MLRCGAPCTKQRIVYVMLLQLYEAELSANSLLKKQVTQLEQELAKSKSESEFSRSRHSDRSLGHFALLVSLISQFSTKKCLSRFKFYSA